MDLLPNDKSALGGSTGQPTNCDHFKLKRRPLILGLLALLLSLLAYLAMGKKPVKHEAVYGGKTVEAWFNEVQFGKADEVVFPAIEALRKLAPESVRYLAARCKQKDSFLQAGYGALWPKLPLQLRARLVRPTTYENDRIRALWALRVMGPPFSTCEMAFSAFATAVSDSNPRVRPEAALALGDLGPEAKAAVPALIRSLRRGGDSREIWALGQMGSEAKAAIPLLEDILKSKAKQSRQTLAYCATALLRIKSSDPAQVAAIARQMESRVERMVLIRPGLIFSRTRATLTAPGNLGETDPALAEAVEVLTEITATSFPSYGYQLEAAGTLLEIHPNSTLGLLRLRDALESHGEPMRFYAAAILARNGIDIDSTVPALVEALNSTRFFKIKAAKSLSQLGPKGKPAIAALTEATQDRDADVRKAATDALLVLSQTR